MTVVAEGEGQNIQCASSVMLHGSETWTVRVDRVKSLERIEMRMVRRMCGFPLKDSQMNYNLKAGFELRG